MRILIYLVQILLKRFKSGRPYTAVIEALTHLLHTFDIRIDLLEAVEQIPQSGLLIGTLFPCTVILQIIYLIHQFQELRPDIRQIIYIIENFPPIAIDLRIIRHLA